MINVSLYKSIAIKESCGIMVSTHVLPLVVGVGVGVGVGGLARSASRRGRHSSPIADTLILYLPPTYPKTNDHSTTPAPAPRTHSFPPTKTMHHWR